MNVRIVIVFIVATVCMISCSNKKTLFESLSSSKTGIDFVNAVEENDKYNVLDYMNIYTGAGVAAEILTMTGWLTYISAGTKFQANYILIKAILNLKI